MTAPDPLAAPGKAMPTDADVERALRTRSPTLSYFYRHERETMRAVLTDYEANRQASPPPPALALARQAQERPMTAPDHIADDGGRLAQAMTEAIDLPTWCARLDAIAHQRGYQPDLTKTTGAECWREYFDEGATPAEALRLDKLNG